MVTFSCSNKRRRSSLKHQLNRECNREAVGGEDALLRFLMESPGDVIFLNDIIACSRSNWGRRGASCDLFIITSFAVMMSVINFLYVEH